MTTESDRSIGSWRSFADAAVRRNVGRLVLGRVGLATVGSSYFMSPSEEWRAALVFSSGCVMTTIAALLPWLSKGKVTAGGGFELEFKEPPDTTGFATQELDNAGQRAQAADDVEADPEDALDVTRFLVADFAVRELLTPRAGELLERCDFHLFMYDEDAEKLVAVFEASEEVAEPAWTIGATVMDDACAAAEYIVAEEAETIFAAMPVLNASGDVIAVLSASSQEPTSPLGSAEGFDEHLSMAEGVARILVDLLKWAED